MTALRTLTAADVRFLMTDDEFTALQEGYARAWVKLIEAEQSGKWRWIHAAEQALALARSRRDARGLEVLLALEADAATYAAPVAERRAADFAVAA